MHDHGGCAVRVDHRRVFATVNYLLVAGRPSEYRDAHRSLPMGLREAADNDRVTIPFAIKRTESCCPSDIVGASWLASRSRFKSHVATW